MKHQSRRELASASAIVGTEGDDYFLVTSPTAVDGRGGFDILAIDFSASLVALHLDLSGLWSGGVGFLNGYEITNIETIGSPYPWSSVENSWILGSELDDVIITGADYPVRVVIAGLGGDDLIIGGAGDPTITNANNFLDGGSGNDIVIGGSRGDDVIGEDGDDRLYGGGGDDIILGNDGRDLLSGGDGNDYLRGDAGDDRQYGDDGDDRLEGGLGSDLLDGGAGSDTVEYFLSETGVVVNLAAGIAIERGAEGASPARIVDHLVSIENATGGFFSDVLIGSASANRLTGDGGDDALYGGGGNDVLSGGSGNDRLEGGHGADRFVFGVPDADAGTGIGFDLIADFSHAEGDVIDLSAIDADRGTFYEDDAFRYIGGAAFSGVAGELRAVAQDGKWEVSGDWDGDGVADFSILVASSTPLGASDFVL